MGILYPKGTSKRAKAQFEAKMRRALQTRAKHKELQGVVVETALRYWRTSMPKPGGGGDAEKFWRACAALEKCETED